MIPIPTIQANVTILDPLKMQKKKQIFLGVFRGYKMETLVRNGITHDFLMISGAIEVNLLQGATKSYFTHYSCVIIVLFNTALCRSAFFYEFF